MWKLPLALLLLATQSCCGAPGRPAGGLAFALAPGPASPRPCSTQAAFSTLGPVSRLPRQGPLCLALRPDARVGQLRAAELHYGGLFRAVRAPGRAVSRAGGRSLLQLGDGGGEAEVIMVGDIVEFSVPEEELCSVGFVEAEEQDDAGQQCLRIMRLVRREGVGEECYLDESQPTLLLTQDSCRFVDSYPSQRVAWSTASPHHNPHGEESEDCWFLEGTLSDTCVIPIKPIAET